MVSARPWSSYEATATPCRTRRGAEWRRSAAWPQASQPRIFGVFRRFSEPSVRDPTAGPGGRAGWVFVQADP